MTKSSQLAIINGSALTESDVLDAVDTVIDNLHQTNDVYQATTVLKTLEKIGEVAGKAKAKLLFGIHRWWLENNMGDFTEYVKTQTTLSPTTVDRYVTVQTYLESGEIPEDISIRPMRELVPIAKALSQGHNISRKQFDKIAKANSQNEIQDILRNVKNKAPRKSSMQIYWEADGSLNVWQNGQKVFIGFLDKKAYENVDLAKKAINRLLDTTGVIRR